MHTHRKKDRKEIDQNGNYGCVWVLKFSFPLKKTKFCVYLSLFNSALFSLDLINTDKVPIIYQHRFIIALP